MASSRTLRIGTSGEYSIVMRSSSNNLRDNGLKFRYGPAGLHIFNRTNGLNVLIDEVSFPPSRYSQAPRQVSIALTNRCDLACGHCYAPKSRHELRYEEVMSWLSELDANGTFGVGFGGGEPTIYPRFIDLCQYASRETQLSVTFTTHGHHIDDRMADGLRGSVHFIRMSMDGIGHTYESIRRRPFSEFLARMRLVATVAGYGINFVVNERTLPDLDQAAAIAADLGSCELLLLPQMPTDRCAAVGGDTLMALRRWVEAYRGSLRLSISQDSSEGFATCDPVAAEQGLHAYAHIDATAVLKPSSFHTSGVPVGREGILCALDRLGQNLREFDE